MTHSAATVQHVIERAGGRCEYCRMHQSLQGATFHIEHIIPRSRGGPSELGNYALCCPSCNLHKANRVKAVDEFTGEATRLFHPRSDRWSDHFSWEAETLIGTSPIGRATVALLQLNRSRRMLIRKAERGFRLFPP